MIVVLTYVDNVCSVQGVCTHCVWGVCFVCYAGVCWLFWCVWTICVVCAHTVSGVCDVCFADVCAQCVRCVYTLCVV